jgi:alpha-tubulin suppressor-like RCC1 family protein
MRSFGANVRFPAFASLLLVTGCSVLLMDDGGPLPPEDPHGAAGTAGGGAGVSGTGGGAGPGAGAAGAGGGGQAGAAGGRGGGDGAAACAPPPAVPVPAETTPYTIEKVFSGGGPGATCALTKEGQLHCWGGGPGLLGTGSPDYFANLCAQLATNAPRAYFDQPVKDVAIGSEQACALLENGKVRCWGQNDKAQLGVGTLSPKDVWVGDDETTCASQDVLLGEGKVVSIASGLDHSCAILEGGKLRCWGSNDHGQLGYGIDDPFVGDKVDRTPATLGDVSVPGRVVQAVLGAQRTCVVADDVPLVGGGKANGMVYCWGDNTYGELGLGERLNESKVGNTAEEKPSAIGPINLDTATGLPAWTAKQLAGHWDHFCVIEATPDTSSSRLRCWGQNTLDGRTGHPYEVDGEIDYSRDVIGDKSHEVPAMLGPVDPGFGAGIEILEVRVGYTFSCALGSNGRVRCWGNNEYGQLGLGHTNIIGDAEIIATAPIEVDLGGLANHLVVGRSHSCAQLVDGKLKCWGRNERGQLGLGHNLDIGDNEKPSAAQPVVACPTASP